MSIAGQRSNEHQPKGDAKERLAQAAPLRLSVRSAFAFLERIIDIIKGEKRRVAPSTGVGDSECASSSELGGWRFFFFFSFYFLFLRILGGFSLCGVFLLHLSGPLFPVMVCQLMLAFLGPLFSHHLLFRYWSTFCDLMNVLGGG